MQTKKRNTTRRNTKKKCVSGCRGFPHITCNHAPRCSFVNGTKPRYQYCRLSPTFMMSKPPKCNVTKRIKKSNIKHHAARQIQRFISNHRSNYFKTVKTPLSVSIKKKSIPKMQTMKAREVIGRFMKRTEHKRKSEFLKSVCSDSGVCIAFGTQRKKIIEFFHGFVEFEYVVPPIKRIGTVSANGFVREIKYERNGYIAHAVLKSSVTEKSDNLAYEYIVGQFVNHLAKSFPCFVETYGLYYYKDNKAWKHIKDTDKITTANVLKDSLEYQSPSQVNDYGKMCINAKYASILIQHLNNVKSFGSIFEHNKYNSPEALHFLLYDSLFVFYQIYFTLAAIKESFTHYDLHRDNVLLYEPIKGKYIEYHYYPRSGAPKVQFKSKYIVKIIDYGRSFYKYSRKRNETNPPDFFNELCAQPLCDPECGAKVGFSWLDDSKDTTGDSYYINSYYSNQSHDLRLVSNFYTDILSKHPYVKEYSTELEKNILGDIIKLLQKVTYGIGIVSPVHRKFGTREITRSGLPDKIYNVSDMEKALREYIQQNPYIGLLNDHEYSNPDNKIGDMYIYADGSVMRFEPSSV